MDSILLSRSLHQSSKHLFVYSRAYIPKQKKNIHFYMEVYITMQYIETAYSAIYINKTNQKKSIPY